jgi:hypothetical protein
MSLALAGADATGAGFGAGGWVAGVAVAGGVAGFVVVVAMAPGVATVEGDGGRVSVTTGRVAVPEAPSRGYSRSRCPG